MRGRNHVPAIERGRSFDAARAESGMIDLKSVICNLHSAIALLVALLAPVPASAQDTTLIPFAIEDQHGLAHRNTDYTAQVVILIGSDREGSQFNGDWDRAIREALNSEPGSAEVTFLPVADLRGVPFFLKGTVRGRFPPRKEDWVLLDWGGVFATAYDFEPKSTNIVIFGTDGSLAHHAHGREVDAALLEAIVTQTRALLASRS